MAQDRLRRESECAEAAMGKSDYSSWRKMIEWLADPKRKWSPIRKLSDREYEEMLQEKLIAVEADLAMVDEEIERVRREEVKRGQRDEGKEG